MFIQNNRDVTPISGEYTHHWRDQNSANSRKSVEAEWTALLASSPDAFVGARNIVPTSQPSSPYRMTNIGLHITAHVHSAGMKWMLLNCYDREDPTKAILLNLRYDFRF